jgi:hypothetical protein
LSAKQLPVLSGAVKDAWAKCEGTPRWPTTTQHLTHFLKPPTHDTLPHEETHLQEEDMEVIQEASCLRLKTEIEDVVSQR